MRLPYSTPESKAHIPPKEDPTLAYNLIIINNMSKSLELNKWAVV